MSDQETIELIVSRFFRGKGASLTKDYTIMTARGGKSRKITIYFIPQSICEDGAQGLLIVANKGNFVWDGKGNINGITMIGNGFQPMALATDVACIAMAIRDQLFSEANKLALVGPEQE